MTEDLDLVRVRRWSERTSIRIRYPERQRFVAGKRNRRRKQQGKFLGAVSCAREKRLILILALFFMPLDEVLAILCESGCIRIPSFTDYGMDDSIHDERLVHDLYRVFARLIGGNWYIVIGGLAGGVFGGLRDLRSDHVRKP